jgi:hypothetical protein
MAFLHGCVEKRMTELLHSHEGGRPFCAIRATMEAARAAIGLEYERGAERAADYLARNDPAIIV